MKNLPIKADRILRIGLLVFLVTLIGSCKSTKNSLDTPSETLEKLSEFTKDRLGEDAITVFNKSNSHALVTLVTAESKTAKSVRFFVFEVKTEKVILEDFTSQGNVEWLDDNQIKVSKIPGRAGPQASRGYIFNLETKQKEQLPL